MFPQQSATMPLPNPMKDHEVMSPPADSISALKFSPNSNSLQKNFLLAGSWDSTVRCWEVVDVGQTIPRLLKTMPGAILDVDWHDDGTKAFIAGSDKTATIWDLDADKIVQVAEHNESVKTCHWIKASTYSCLMTGEIFTCSYEEIYLNAHNFRKLG